MNQLWTRENSRVDFSDGSLSHDLRTYENSLLPLTGDDFQINGVSVGYGDSARDYAISGDLYGAPCLLGDLTGTLAGGQTLDIPFYIFDDSDIVFVPEPCTMALLLFGSFMIRKRSA